MVDGEGTNIVYTFDDADRLVGVTEGGSTRGTYYYDAAGKRMTLALGNSSYALYLYDGAGRLTSVANKKSDASDVSRFEYALDGAGVRRTMTISGSAYTSASVGYDYDGAYQLTKETRTGGSAYTQSFLYDNSGNRTKSNLGGTDTVYYYDYIDRMTKYGTTTLEWDTWGNMTKVGTHGYYYDNADRLTKYDYSSGTSNDSTYSYLPGSWKRYKRVQDTTAQYYVYDGDNVLDSYASNGNLNARYVTPGLDENLSMTRSGNTYYYMADGLGSVRNVLESDEDVANTYDYYAFGNTLGTPTVGVTNPFEYTAREFEDGSVNTTFYYRHRYYMSALGIFTSRDAMWADIHRGSCYVRNNPVIAGDPSGSELVTGIGLGLAAAAAALLSGCSSSSEDPTHGMGQFFPRSRNCCGYANDFPDALQPSEGHSLKDLMDGLGWECKMGVSAKDCQEHCKGQGKCQYVEVYVFFPPYGDSDAGDYLRRARKYRHPFTESRFAANPDLGMHWLKGDGKGGYTYYPGGIPKSCDKTGTPESWSPTDEAPDFGLPGPLAGKACCCK